MEYIFVLGRQPALSLAEILSLFKNLKINYQVNLFQPETLILNVEKPLDVDFLMSQLGGTIKIGLVKYKTDGEWEKNIIAMIKDKVGRKEKGKIYFGLSGYGKGQKIFSRQELGRIGLKIKRQLEEEGLAVRFVTSREPTLSSVVVKTNKLLSDRGIEILIANSPDTLWLAETQAIQPFAELSERDYGRPGRDALAGMLPPKLAKIMINLAEVGPTAAILDPFCGSGTILTEAALMGYGNIYGSDINPQAITDTKKNLLWLKSKILDIKILDIKNCDARRLSRCFSSRSIDAIITEPFLGPPLTGRETAKQIDKIIKSVSSLYLASLCEFKKILKPDGKIVIIWPVFHHPRPPPRRHVGASSSKEGDSTCLPLTKGEIKRGFLLISDETKKLGFRTEPLLPPDFAYLLTDRGTLIYSRPEQKVGREMVKLIFHPLTRKNTTSPSRII